MGEWMDELLYLKTEKEYWKIILSLKLHLVDFHLSFFVCVCSIRGRPLLQSPGEMSARCRPVNLLGTVVSVGQGYM